MKIIYDQERNLYQPATTEEHVIKQITQGLSLHGFKVFRIVERIPTRNKRGCIVGRFSTPGMPDLCVRKGPFQFWIEVKRPGGSRRPRQIRWIEEANDDGVLAFFASSWDEVIPHLRGRGFM